MFSPGKANKVIEVDSASRALAVCIARLRWTEGEGDVCGCGGVHFERVSKGEYGR